MFFSKNQTHFTETINKLIDHTIYRLYAAYHYTKSPQPSNINTGLGLGPRLVYYPALPIPFIQSALSAGGICLNQGNTQAIRPPALISWLTKHQHARAPKCCEYMPLVTAWYAPVSHKYMAKKDEVRHDHHSVVVFNDLISSRLNLFWLTRWYSCEKIYETSVNICWSCKASVILICKIYYCYYNVLLL